MTHEGLISVSKTPPGGEPFDPRPAKEACRAHDEVGMYAYHLIDDVAERFLDLIDDYELFPRDVEISFGNAFDKLLRASEALDASRDSLAGVRDYLQGRIANDQNEVMKRLTVIASLLLLPTFISS